MLRFLDGFDHYASGDITGKWTAAQFVGSSGVVTTAPRTGPRCLKLVPAGASGSYALFTNPGGLQPTMMCGFGFKYNLVDNAPLFCGFGDNGSGAGNTQVALVLNYSGTISVVRGGTVGSNSTGVDATLGTTSVALAAGRWYYLELKVTFHNTTGSVVLSVNGSVALTLTGVDTQHTSNASANVLAFGGAGTIGSAEEHYFDDVYVADTVAGDGVVDTLGPQRIATVLPSPGNGFHTDWTPSTGTDHGSLVDDVTPNDTDGVTSLTVGHRDTYNFPALSLDGTVTAVQATQWAKLTAPGVRSLSSCTRIAGATYDGTTAVPLDTDYLGARQIWTQSPATASAWNVAEIDAAEFGPVVAA